MVKSLIPKLIDNSLSDTDNIDNSDFFTKSNDSNNSLSSSSTTTSSSSLQTNSITITPTTTKNNQNNSNNQNSDDDNNHSSQTMPFKVPNISNTPFAIIKIQQQPLPHLPPFVSAQNGQTC